MVVPCVFDSFEQALCSFVTHYIMTYGFKAFQQLPMSRARLENLMLKEGYQYAS